MGTRHPNPNLVKIHITYSVDEIARRLKLSKGTVRRWLKTGLDSVGGKGMTIVRGSVLRAFLRKRRESAKRPCQPGFLYCLRCRAPKEPANCKADLVYVDQGNGKPTRVGNLRGICPDCSALMHRRVNLERLSLVRGNLEIALSEPLSRLRGTPSPSLNSDLSKDDQEHENA
jgi:hypothetical protein